MRLAMPETLAAAEAMPVVEVLAAVATRHTRVLVLGVLACMSATVSIYVLNDMTTCPCPPRWRPRW